jgi:hypothetical protein
MPPTDTQKKSSPKAQLDEPITAMCEVTRHTRTSARTEVDFSGCPWSFSQSLSSIFTAHFSQPFHSAVPSCGERRGEYCNAVGGARWSRKEKLSQNGLPTTGPPLQSSSRFASFAAAAANAPRMFLRIMNCFFFDELPDNQPTQAAKTDAERGKDK